MFQWKSPNRIARLTTTAAILSMSFTLPGCAVADADPRDSEPAPSASATTGEGLTAKAAGAIETAYFDTDLPVGWEVLSDEIDTSGQMTLGEKGSNGAQGIYVQFEPGFTGDPMATVEQISVASNGSTPEALVRNGINWVHTSYSESGADQSLYVTAHNGYKITFTVMGRDYDSDPGVKTIFDTLRLR